MNLAIQRLQQLARETEVQLEQATNAHKVHERTVAESAAQVVHLTALLADLKAAAAALPVVALKAVPSAFSVPASEVKPVETSVSSEPKAKKKS